MRDAESYDGDINAWKEDNFELDGIPSVMLFNGELAVHYFTSSGRAYNECQCNPRIKTGDVLVVQSESVIALADAWPVPITSKGGEFGQLKDERLGPDGKLLDDNWMLDSLVEYTSESKKVEERERATQGLRVARRLATEAGWPAI
jgi:hypothetical protein